MVGVGVAVREEVAAVVEEREVVAEAALEREREPEAVACL